MRSFLRPATLVVLLGGVLISCNLVQREELPSVQTPKVAVVRSPALGGDTFDFTAHVDPGSYTVTAVYLDYVLHDPRESPFAGAELVQPVVTEVQESQTVAGFYGQSLLDGALEMDGKSATFRWVLEYRAPGGKAGGVVASPFYRTSPFKAGLAPSFEEVTPAS